MTWNRKKLLHKMLDKARRGDLATITDYILDPKEIQRSRNEDTSSRVKSALAAVDKKNSVVIATYAASKGPDHEIRLARNGTVFCTGKCWQYSKTGTCKHLEHYRSNATPQKFGRIEKL